MSSLERINATIQKVSNLGPLEPSDDIYEKGLASTKALQLLLELEEQFQVSIPDSEFVAARTLNDLAALVDRLSKQ